MVLVTVRAAKYNVAPVSAPPAPAERKKNGHCEKGGRRGPPGPKRVGRATDVLARSTSSILGPPIDMRVLAWAVAHLARGDLDPPGADSVTSSRGGENIW